MSIKEKIEYLAKAVMTLSELGDGKTAYALNEIRLEMKNQLELPAELEEAAMEYAEKHGFRVPYDGSNNFYDDVDVKASKEGFIAGAEWQKNQMLIKSSKKEVDEFMSRCDRDVLDELNRWRFTTVCQEFIEQGIFDYGCAKHFAEWGRKQVLQEIYDGKVKPVDKITAAWLDDEQNI